jgi:hypothetical protein
MKRARIINAIAWAIIAITLCVWVAIEWHNQGCEAKSLVIACVTYTAMATGIGGTIDQTIKESQN